MTAKTYATLEAYKVAANAALAARYGLTFDEAGADDSDLARWYAYHLETGETVEELAAEYGEDYDLSEPDPMTARMLKERHPIPAP